MKEMKNTFSFKRVLLVLLCIPIVLIILFILLILVQGFVIQEDRLGGETMTTSYSNDTKFLLDKILFKYQGFSRGDIVKVTIHEEREQTLEELKEYNDRWREYYGENNWQDETMPRPLSITQHVGGRVIGLPGDEILLKDGVVFTNGVRLDEEYLEAGTKTQPGPLLLEGKAVKVPEGKYFILGDNREILDDSRKWGFFQTKTSDANYISGKAIKCTSNCPE